MNTTNPNQNHNHPKGLQMKTLIAPATISIAALPAVGADLDGGIFAGLTTRKDGTHYAVVLLPQYAEDLTWENAKAWAAEQGGELPTRPVAALLFANTQNQLKPEWHWTSDEYNASYAWYCTFGYGYQFTDLKSSEGSVVAVRLIPLTAHRLILQSFCPQEPPMNEITLEVIEAKQTELSQLIAKFKTQANEPTVLVIPELKIELQHGEHYAGAVLDESGHVLHHLVLMAQSPTDELNWQAATDWAARVGGTLPSRQEQALLYANCKPHLENTWHWSSETHEDDASYAWGCDFGNGNQGKDHESSEGSVVAVRRIHLALSPSIL